MHASFEDAVEELCRKHPEYAQDAYYFLRSAIDFAAEQLDGKNNHPNLSAKDLYVGACAYALEEYGPLARKVLESWNICSAQDFGKVVYNLIEAGIFGKQKDDSPADFDHLESLAALLNAPFSLPDELADALLEAEERKLQELSDLTLPPYSTGKTENKAKPSGKRSTPAKQTATGTKKSRGKKNTSDKHSSQAPTQRSRETPPAPESSSDDTHPKP